MRIGIVDAVLICNQCSQKIKMKHLKCQKEKREKLILEIVNDLEWIQEDFYNEDEENRTEKIKKKWEMLK